MDEHTYYGKFCGRTARPLISVKTTPLYVHFHSDVSVSGQGFSAMYLLSGKKLPLGQHAKVIIKNGAIFVPDGFFAMFAFSMYNIIIRGALLEPHAISRFRVCYL